MSAAPMPRSLAPVVDAVTARLVSLLRDRARKGDERPLTLRDLQRAKILAPVHAGQDALPSPLAPKGRARLDLPGSDGRSIQELSWSTETVRVE